MATLKKLESLAPFREPIDIRMEDEKNQYEINDAGSNGSPKHEHGEHAAVRMGDRKESVVLQEAADLYGDVHTAESERMNQDQS